MASIIVPNRKPDADPLEKLAQAVDIARSIYGINVQSKELEMAKEKLANDKSLAEQNAARQGTIDEKTSLEIEKLKREQEIAAKSADPSTPLSKAAREAAKRRGLILPNEVSAAEIDKNFGSFIKPESAAGNKPAAKSQKEFSDRYANINTQIDVLKKLVDEKGTNEAFGSHNEKLQQSLDSVAIDAAKLFDPESVARESEVAAFKNMLFEGGTLTKSNKTAIELLNNFKSVIASRAANQYPDLLRNNAGGAAKPKTLKTNQIEWAD